MKKAFVIFLFISLIVGGKVIVDSALLGAMESIDFSTTTPKGNIQLSVDDDLGNQEIYNQMSLGDYEGRNLSNYYKNRAYNGAPPTIPHAVEDELSIGGKSCLQCHQKGGFVHKYDAFAPVTPHPEKLNCVQCHASVKTEGLFKESYWDNNKQAPPLIQNQAMENSPPTIPHELSSFRDKNCLSCHAGPAAPKEIRVSHPERINCIQCHAEKKATDVFFNPIK